MGPSTEPLRFREAAAPGDADFLSQLSRSAFGAWSRDPARAIGRMLERRAAFGEIAYVGREPIGFYIIEVNPLGRAYGPFERPAVAHLDAIAVLPKHMRRGVGRSLLLRAEHVARERSVVVMTLMTAIGNARARRMFQRFGFMPILKLNQAYESGEAGIHMFKLIADIEHAETPTMH